MANWNTVSPQGNTNGLTSNDYFIFIHLFNLKTWPFCELISNSGLGLPMHQQIFIQLIHQLSLSSLPENRDTADIIQTPCEAAISQPGPTVIPDFALAICHHYPYMPPSSGHHYSFKWPANAGVFLKDCFRGLAATCGRTKCKLQLTCKLLIQPAWELEIKIALWELMKLYTLERKQSIFWQMIYVFVFRFWNIVSKSSLNSSLLALPEHCIFDTLYTIPLDH